MDKAIGNAEIRRWILGMILSILLIPVSAYAQTQRTVTGTVLDETGEPLIGATVKVEGTTLGTSTDFDGHFSLNIPESAKQLTFSYVGYINQTVEITSDVIDVTLQPNSEILDEVVVIGYGTQKKDDLTGSIATVSEKDFNQGVISSPEELINGKIAGVQITNNGGSPNGGATIRVRGGASLNASNDPLIVLDGVP
ncbi:MAG: carboxypeptidase-like regulatory domain-containing protein, partial [Muribaculaceae bacterium]|nr:carboxypeptidase-like regulatory domain-containing protein [Muribaculaceae bacterium]